MATGRLDHEISVVYSSLHQLTIIIHHSGLLLAAVHWETDNLHLHEGINDLTEKRYTALRHSFILTLLWKGSQTFQQSDSITCWLKSYKPKL